MSLDPEDLPVGLSEWKPSPWEQEFIEDQTSRAQDETDTPEGDPTMGTITNHPTSSHADSQMARGLLIDIAEETSRLRPQARKLSRQEQDKLDRILADLRSMGS